MKAMWSYRSKRILGILVSLIVVVAFSYMFFNTDIPPKKTDMTDAAYIIYCKTYITYNRVFYAITLIIAFIEFWAWINNAIKKLSSESAIMVLVPLLPAATNFYINEQNLLQALYLIIICFAFFCLLICVTGRSNNSSKAIKTILYEMRKKENDVNFVGGEANNHINVVQVNTVPSNPNSISSMKYEDLNRTIKKYTKGPYKIKKNEEKKILLIGDFGSGKSTALLSCVINSLKWPILPNLIPVYIRLKDVIDNSILNENGISQISKESLFEKYYETATDKKDLVRNYLVDLESSGRIIYFFDGLNELLQSYERNEENQDENEENQDENEIKSNLCKRIYTDLYGIASGNPFVLTTCTFPDVITDGMIGQKNRPEIFVIKGVRLNKKQTQSQWINKYEVLFNSSVALYRLKESYENEENNARFTPYESLRQFALKDRDIDENTPEGKNQAEALYKVLNQIVKDNIENRYNPYAALTPEVAFGETRMFNSDPFTTCHILFFEFLLAQYARTLIKDKRDDFVNFFFEELKKKQKDSATNEEELSLLNSPHMSNAFKMMLTDVYVNPQYADEISDCDKAIKQIYTTILGEKDVKGKYIINEEKEERILKFFILLSIIKDEIMLYGKSNLDIRSFSIELDKSLSQLWSVFKNPEVPMSFRFQMAKLFSAYKDDICKMDNLLHDALKKEWTHTGVQRQLLYYYIDNEKHWPKEEHRIDKYLMQEYPAELIRLDGMIESINENDNDNSEAESVGTDKDKLKVQIHDFYTMRLKGIRNTNRWYGVLICILLVQIYFLSLNAGIFHLPALIIKCVGLALAIGSCRSWNKQLWKNEEYYGLALNNFSLDEPIYEVIKVVLGRNNKEDDRSTETKTIADDKATIVIGDWLKNRPSIIFLLASVVSSIYVHSLLQYYKVNNGLSYILELLIMLFLLFVCCVPCVTYHYEQIDKNGIVEKGKGIIKVMCFLVIVVFGLPMMATTCGEMFWGWWTGSAFSVIGLVLFIIMWVLFVRKAEGESKTVSIREHFNKLYKLVFKDKKHKHNLKRRVQCIKESIKGANIIPLRRRILAFVSLLVFFCAPGIVLNWLFPSIAGNDVNAQAGAAIAVFMLAISVYFSLHYASYARKERKIKNDADILKKNEQAITDYAELSCSGQVKLLNMLRNTEDGQKIIKSKMKKLQEKAKTVAALDVLLDIESSDVHSILHKRGDAIKS